MSKNDEEVPAGRIPGISYFLSLPAEIFLSLAKTRNFSATAAQFGLSQSSVSRRITELEEEIGAALINRTHGICQDTSKKLVRSLFIPEEPQQGLCPYASLPQDIFLT